MDGEKFVTVRQGYFPAQQKVMVGVMCCAPEGPGLRRHFRPARARDAPRARRRAVLYVFLKYLHGGNLLPHFKFPGLKPLPD